MFAAGGQGGSKASRMIKKFNKSKLIDEDFYLPYNPDLIEKARSLRKIMTDFGGIQKTLYGFIKKYMDPPYPP